MTPADAIRRFLDALGVAPPRIPTDLEAQANLYRSLLADKRMLVVLDNARDAEQVRPLLPGSRSSLLLVTSRNRLASFVATSSARPLMLDVLTEGEAYRLLIARLGEDRVTTDPEAAEEIIALCAGLPLALAVVAARAATDPRTSLKSLTVEMRDARNRLDAFDNDDPTTDLRAVFSWSYQQLTPQAKRLFRLLGLHAGPDISAQAAASLGGRPLQEARELVSELTHANLVAEHDPGRYTFHDLLRAYAAELASTHANERDRRAATHRLLDHYLHTACTADRLLEPLRDPIVLRPCKPKVVVETLNDAGQAMGWFAAERQVLVAAISYAADNAFSSHATQLAWASGTFVERQGRWREWILAYRAAVKVAQRLTDRNQQALAHRNLARAHAQLGAYDEAHSQLQQSLRLYQELKDLNGQALVHHNLAWVLEQQGRWSEALTEAKRSVELKTIIGDPAGLAHSLNSVGMYYASLGNYQEGVHHCQQARRLAVGLGYREAEANALDSLGSICHDLGNHPEAISYLELAIKLYRNTGHRYFEARALSRLGDTYQRTSNHAAARAMWREALIVLKDLGRPEADQVLAKLEQLGHAQNLS